MLSFSLERSRHFLTGAITTLGVGIKKTNEQLIFPKIVYTAAGYVSKNRFAARAKISTSDSRSRQSTISFCFYAVSTDQKLVYSRY